MKRWFKYIIIVLALFFANCGQRNISAQSYEVSFQMFFDHLSPHGFWTLHPDYGYVWIPDVGPGFMPYYSDGHWVYSEYGWTWMSYYDWGWAPFHYGRWDWDDLYGWFWVPGNEWGPAWVVWRRASGYYGWAPMSPGLSVNVNVGVFRNRPERWIFVPARDIARRDFHHYHVDRSKNITIINNSTVINQTYNDNRRNTTYVTGPSPQDVQRESGRRIRAVRIENNSQPGSNLNENRLEIYRPSVRRTAPGTQKPAPPQVMDIQDVRRRRGTPAGTSTEPSASPNTLRRGREEPQAAPSREQYQKEASPSNRREGTPQEQPEMRQPRRAKPESTPQSAPANNRRNEQSTPAPSQNPAQQSEPAKEQVKPQQQPKQQNTPSQRRRSGTNQQESKPKVQSGDQVKPAAPSNRRQGEKSSGDNKTEDGTSGQGGRRR